MIRVLSEGLLRSGSDGYYDDYLHDSRCDDKSDLSARSSTIEIRGELPLRQFMGKGRDLSPQQE